MPDYRLSDATLREIVATRVHGQAAIAQAAARRTKVTSVLGDTGRAMIIAADHPARGANAVGEDPNAMADRAELLGRRRAPRSPGPA